MKRKKQPLAMQAYAAAPSLLGRSTRCHPESRGRKQEAVLQLTTVFPRARDQMHTIFWHEAPRAQPQSKKARGGFLLAPLVAHNPEAISASVAGTPTALSWEAASGGGGGGGGGGSPAPAPPPASVFRPRDAYVAVPKSQLRELSKLERHVQEERAALGEQCTFLWDDTQVSTRLASPFTVEAVNAVCDLELAQAATAARKLRAWRWKGLAQCIAEWEASRHALGYLNLTGYTPKEHMELAPLVSRPRVNQATLVKFFRGRWMAWQQQELEQEERERQTMVREEAAQRQVQRGMDAQERKADYGIYVMLASLYGPLPPAVYEATPRPGEGFRAHCAAAVRTLEIFWRLYRSWRAQKKMHAARHFQRWWRGIVSRGRMNGVHVLRDRLRQQHLARNFGAWRALAAKMSRSRNFLRRLLLECEQRALDTWHAAAAAQVRSRERIYELLCARYRLNTMSRHFGGWCKAVRDQLRIKAFIKRSIVDNEHHVFDLWAANVKERRRIRLCKVASVHAQRMIRGHFDRQLVTCKRHAFTVASNTIERVFRGHLARRETMHGRRLPMLQSMRNEFWQQQKMAERRAFEVDREAEVARMARETLLVGLAEADALARIGALNRLSFGHGSKARRAKLQAAARALARHEFRRLHPTTFAHMDPAQSTTFVRQEQYVRHVAEREGHMAARRAHLHLMLLREEGWPLLERFLEHEGGVVVVRNLLFWRRCQELRGVPANTREFQRAAEDICTRFVALEPENRVHVALEVVERIVRVVGRMSDGDKDGFVPPDVFAEAEFCVLNYLGDVWWAKFLLSPEAEMWRAVLASEARRREGLEVAFFKRRKALMLQDARDVRYGVLRQVVWKRHVVAIVFLRERAREALRQHNRRMDAKLSLLVAGRRALAKDFLLGRVHKARWHLQRKARACRVLRARARRAQVHCARRDASHLSLRASAAHAQRQADSLAFLQVRSVMNEMVVAVACSGVVYVRQRKAVTWLRARVQRAQAHWRQQDVAEEFLVSWGCRVLGKSTPSELRAAVQLQRVSRGFLARRQYHVLINALIDKVFDMSTGRYYFVNKRTGVVSWSPPAGMGSEPMLTPRSFRTQLAQQGRERTEFRGERCKAQRQARGGFKADEAALVIQCAMRSALARNHFKQLLAVCFDKEYDNISGQDFFINKVTGATTVEQPAILERAGLTDLLSPRTLMKKQKAETKALRDYTRNRKITAQVQKSVAAQQARARAVERRGGLTTAEAAVRIQSQWRSCCARKLLLAMARARFRLEYDATGGYVARCVHLLVRNTSSCPARLTRRYPGVLTLYCAILPSPPRSPTANTTT
jgi:hypothetical protein